jgi:uncharacterized protein with PIN domain
MDDPVVYSRSELDRLRKQARRGGALRCPRCSEALLPRSVPPRSEVGYVRSRVWWVCPACRRSAVLDQREAEHDPPTD